MRARLVGLVMALLTVAAAQAGSAFGLKDHAGLLPTGLARVAPRQAAVLLGSLKVMGFAAPP